MQRDFTKCFRCYLVCMRRSYTSHESLDMLHQMIIYQHPYLVLPVLTEAWGRWCASVVLKLGRMRYYRCSTVRTPRALAKTKRSGVTISGADGGTPVLHTYEENQYQFKWTLRNGLLMEIGTWWRCVVFSFSYRKSLPAARWCVSPNRQYVTQSKGPL